jgi:hypothetical protein
MDRSETSVHALGDQLTLTNPYSVGRRCGNLSGGLEAGEVGAMLHVAVARWSLCFGEVTHLTQSEAKTYWDRLHEGNTRLRNGLDHLHIRAH